MKANQVQKELRKLGSPARAKASAWYFKTGKGQYGEGDKFIGVTVPEQRRIATKFKDLPFVEIKKLLASPFHEDRFTALEILVMQYEKADEKIQKNIFDFYLRSSKRINNWDLVDTSASYIAGAYLFTHPKERAILNKLVVSKLLWERRIAIIATMYFINQGRYNESLELASKLLADSEDLIHKAVGWVLREIWKRDSKFAESFLDKYNAKIPRVTLRYAIERMPEKKRKMYLSK